MELVSAQAGQLPEPPRRQRLLAFARFALFVVLWVPAVAIWLRSGLAVPPIPYMAGPLPMLLGLVGTPLYALVGLAISQRRHEVRTGRILAWAAVVLALDAALPAVFELSCTSAEFGRGERSRTDTLRVNVKITSDRIRTAARRSA